MVNIKYDINTIGMYANIPKKLLSEFKVVTDDCDYYHIALNNSSSMSITIPVNVPRTYLSGENNTILRISIAKTIQNCINGFHGHTLINRWRINNNQFNIYKITSDVVLKPSTNIVNDVNNTSEYWLVNYDGHHDSYTLYAIGTIIGVAQYTGYCNGVVGVKKDLKTICVYGLDLWDSAVYNTSILSPGYYKITYIQKDNTDKYYTSYRLNIDECGGNSELFSSYYAIEKMNDYMTLKKAILSNNGLPF